MLWGDVVEGGVVWGCCGRGGYCGGRDVVGVLWEVGKLGLVKSLEFLKGLLVGRLFGKGLVERKNSKKGVGGEEEFEEKDKISGEDKI